MAAPNSTQGLPDIKVEDQDTSIMSLGHCDESDVSSSSLFSTSPNKQSSPDLFEDIKVEEQIYHMLRPWSAQDEHFAQMFRYWHHLPMGGNPSYEEKLHVLRCLEDVIVPFEKAIHSSDTNFAAWVLHHQAAMEAGLSPIPGWPHLIKGNRWDNNTWNARYLYLVTEREKLIAWRFQSLEERPVFRGSHAPRPGRLTTKRMGDKHGNRSSTLPRFWYRSLDEFLTAEAEKHKIPAQHVLATFWNWLPSSELNEEPALTNVSSGSESPSPPTPSTEAKIGMTETIKIESDSE